MATQTTRVVPKASARDLAALDTAVDAITGVDATRQVGATATVGGAAQIAAQGTLTIAEPVSDGDEFTIGATVYTLLDAPAAAYDIEIGANEAATKVNIVAAINASGTPGTEYFAGTLRHPTVQATTFAGDACVLTARGAGIAGNSIVTAESGQGFTHSSNIFDGATLGTTTLGAGGEVHFGVSGVEVDCDDGAMTYPDDLETSAITVLMGDPADADRDDLTGRPT